MCWLLLQTLPRWNMLGLADEPCALTIPELKDAPAVARAAGVKVRPLSKLCERIAGPLHMHSKLKLQLWMMRMLHLPLLCSFVLAAANFSSEKKLLGSLTNLRQEGACHVAAWHRDRLAGFPHKRRKVIAVVRINCNWGREVYGGWIC